MTQEGAGVELRSFLAFSTSWPWYLATCPMRLTPEERVPGDQWATVDRNSKKWTSFSESQGEIEYRNYNKKKKATWIGHIFYRNCFLKHVIEENIKRRMEVEEENVSSYWMTLRKREDTAN
jgi:hypothetical protein